MLRDTAKATIEGNSTLNLNNFAAIGKNALIPDKNIFSGNDSTVNISTFLDLGTEDGSTSQMNLTNSSINSLYARILHDTTLTADDSQITFRDNGDIDDSSLTLNNSSQLFFGDGVTIQHNGSLNLNGSSITHETMTGTGNTGSIVVGQDGTLQLNNSTVDLVSAGGPDYGMKILANSTGQVSAIDSTIKTRTVSVEDTGSVYSQTGGSLTTHALTSGDNGEIRLNTTQVDSDYISVNGLLDATDTTLNLAGDNFSGTNGTTTLTGGTLNISGPGDIDLLGTSTFTASGTQITADKLLLRDTAKATIEGNSTLNLNNFAAIRKNALIPDKNIFSVNDSTVNISTFLDLGTGGRQYVANESYQFFD